MKVLLVRLSSMGDLVHTLPAVEDLSCHCPEIELHWLCEAGFSDIARLHPFVKRVIPMSWRQWRKKLLQKQTWQEMKCLKATLSQENYDLVLDSQGLLKSSFFARWAKAPVVGFDENSIREKWAAYFYEKKYEVAKGKSAIWRNRALFSRVFNYQMPEKKQFGVRVPKDCAFENLPQSYRVALHATSRDSKLWPQKDWIALLNKLYQYDGLPVLLMWGNESERQRAMEIAKSVPQAQVCPKLSLLQAAYILSGAVSVVGVDTGLLHLANAVDRPLVGIYTDSNPYLVGVEAEWAENLGGIGIIPSDEEVFQSVLKMERYFNAHKTTTYIHKANEKS